MTPDENNAKDFLDRLTETIEDEEDYLSEVYGDMYDVDDESIEFDDYVGEQEAIIREYSVANLNPSYFRTWRDECARYPENSVCDECIYEYYRLNPIYIGGPRHGSFVEDDLQDRDEIRYADVAGIPLNYRYEVDPHPITTFHVYHYTRRSINVIRENRRNNVFYVWVQSSIRDPQEAFQLFYSTARGEEERVERRERRERRASRSGETEERPPFL